MRFRSPWLFALLSLTTAACERCAPGQVGMGVSRMTIRNFGTMVEIVNADTQCGFESERVKSNPTLSGNFGSTGSATWTVENCRVDLTEPKVVTDCHGVSTVIAGVVTVSATRTIVGTLTGDPNSPIIPSGPDAVTVDVSSAVVDNFVVEKSDNRNILTMIEGSLSGVARPRIAADSTLGVCSIATKNAAFDNVQFNDGRVRVQTADRDFIVPVPHSRFDAIYGVHSGQENALAGEITVWGSEELIPNGGDVDGLDPEYDAALFISAFECIDQLKNPIDYDCAVAVGPQLAQAAARLSMRNVGTLVDRLEDDTRCGFSAPAVMESARADVAAGALGTVTMTVSGCELDFGESTVVATDCTGRETRVSGKVTVSGTKQLRGRVTGDRSTPVIPMTDDPAEFNLEVNGVDGFAVEQDGTAMSWLSGGLRARLTPRVARDSAQQGACGFETPIADIEVAYQPMDVRLRSSSGSFRVHIDQAQLTALNGTWGARSNELDGTIALDQTTYSLPTDPNDDGLDPEFDQAQFDARWQCGSVEQPISHECHFGGPIAHGASRLSIQLLGKLNEMIERDTRCGFSSSRVIEGVAITGNVGAPGGTAVFTIDQPCELQFPEGSVWMTDCNGKRYYVSGTARVRGTKTLSGYVSGDPLQPIVPTSRDPAAFELAATFDHFKLYSDPAINRLEIVSGGMSGSINPRVAQDLSNGACSVATPVAEFSGVRFNNAEVLLESEGKTFGARLDGSDLYAVNGTRDHSANVLSGTVNMDGVDYGIPVTGDPILDPAFDPTVFEASYACLPNINVPLDESVCNMKQTLGEGAARLLVLALGSVSGMANSDETCGFSTRNVLTNPTQVVGPVGSIGSMRWDVGGCTLAGNPNAPLKTDCMGRNTYVTGQTTFSGRRDVVGLRDEVRVLLIIRFDSIIPVTRDAVALTFNSLSFNNFLVQDVEPGATTLSRGLRLRSGLMSARVEPLLGERASSLGTFDIPTPLALMTQLRVSNADARIYVGPKRFDVRIDAAELTAFNGSWVNAPLENHLEGTISIDGTLVTIPPMGLDPDYDQTNFDTRYACTNDLRNVIPYRRP